MDTLLILKTGSTFAELAARRGDFESWFETHLLASAGHSGKAVRVVTVAAQSELELPPLAGIDGIIVTGSPSAVHDHEPWSVRAGEWLRAAVVAGAPVLGVCYGHQLIADSSGGRSGQNPAGREIGLVEVTVAEDPLFAGLPASFPVFTSHNDAVLTAPPGSQLLASNGHTAIQALAVGARARTVQWHPEFDVDIIRHYLHARAPLIDADRGEGTTASYLAALRETASGPVILGNFLRYYVRGGQSG